MELFIEDDSDSDCSVDSFALLPDLRPCVQDVNGLNPRSGQRARSALRRHRPVSSSSNTDKTPFDISNGDLAFQSSNNVQSDNRNLGELLI